MPSTTQRTKQGASHPATVTHPLYTDFLPQWTQLAHVREGIGGFLDGTYLIAHPREWKDHQAVTPKIPTKKLVARRELACYENIAATILEAKKSALFRETVTRRVGNAERKEGQQPSAYETWLQNVDGKRTHIDDYMRAAWDPAATFGHLAIYMDRPAGPAPATAADQRQPILRKYAPGDILDWSDDENGELTEILFLEAVPREVGKATAIADFRTRRVTRELWQLRDKGGATLNEGEHKFGCLPVALLYSQRRPLLPTVGHSVLGDPKLYIDLYNLLSELRELLRSQTFSILNIPLGTGDQAMSVDDAAKLIGEKIATDNVLFSGLAAAFISAEAANVTVYQDEINRRLRTIYRLTALAWEADSRDAEAEGSMQLKREDMNQRLASYADELEKTEYKIAELYYRATLGDRWEKQLEKEPVVIRYPDNFDVTPFEKVLEQIHSVMNLGMPDEVMKELRKRLLPQLLPDIPPEQLKKLQAAIDSAKPEPSPAERAKERIKEQTALRGAA